MYSYTQGCSCRLGFSPWDILEAQILGTDAATSVSILAHFNEWRRWHWDAGFSYTSSSWLPSLKLSSILSSKIFGIVTNESVSKWSHILRQPFFRNYFLWQFSEGCLNSEVFIIPGELHYQVWLLPALPLLPPAPLCQKLILTAKEREIFSHAIS